jgi:hypothetical protein
MLKIQFPKHDFKIKKEDQREFVFDETRKKWVRLTPEEWVRQNFLQYLIQTKKYPSTLFSIEKEFLLNDMKKRCDIVVYKNEIPWMIVECKETSVQLNEPVLQQILRYNMALPVEYLIITNGHYSFGWQRKNNEMNALDELPEWV